MKSEMYPVREIQGFLLRYDPEFTRDDLGYVECDACGARTQSYRLRDHRPTNAGVRHCGIPLQIRDENLADAKWKVYVFGPGLIEKLKPLVRNRPYVLWAYEKEWFGVSLQMVFTYDKSLLERDNLRVAKQQYLLKEG